MLTPIFPKLKQLLPQWVLKVEPWLQQDWKARYQAKEDYS